MRKISIHNENYEKTILNVRKNVSKKHLKFIISAINESCKSDMMQRHGCVIRSGNKIISKGHNHMRNYSSNGLMKNCCSCHAEVDALHNLSKSHGLTGHYLHWVQTAKGEKVNEKNNSIYC